MMRDAELATSTPARDIHVTKPSKIEIERRAALGLAGASLALMAGSRPAAAQREPVPSLALPDFLPSAPGGQPRSLLAKVGEITSIADFGAVGDHVPGKARGRDNSASILAALSASPTVYVPAGRYRLSGWPTLRKVIDSTFFGPGELFYDDGNKIERIGSFIRAGICDPNGINGTLAHGGIVVGGEGPGVNGALLHAQHPAWPIVQPTRGGSAIEFQIYNYAHVGAARRIPETGRIEAVYGDFRSRNIDAGDVLGFEDRLYAIASKLSDRELELSELNGAPVAFADDRISTYRHAYYYGDGVCSCNGTAVTRLSGDNFFNVATIPGQSTISFGGRRWPIAKVTSPDELVLTESAGRSEALPFVLKMLPLSLQVSMLRLQGMIGGSEEAFSIAECIDGVIRMRTERRGHGGFRHFSIATGRDADYGYHTEHLVISSAGQIGLGKNYLNPKAAFPTTAKLHVWRDGTKKAEKDGRNDVRIAVFETNHGGPAPRQLHIGCLNNYHAGYIQGYADGGAKNPGPMTINPFGGPVGVSTGSDSALTHALEVNGTVGPHADGKSTLGTATHRWSAVFSATGVVQTSDAHEKQDAHEIPDDLIDAFLDVEPKVFRWRASVAEKGDAARHHLGYVAQEIAAALTRRGVDPARFGLWCEDALTSAVETADGTVEQRPTGTYRQALRYDQLLALIDAANRRRMTRIEDRLRALEARL